MPLILPTSYVPPIEFFALLLNEEGILIEKYEYFIKQSLRNHCTILGANGKLKLTIPLASRKNKTLTKDIKISYSENWQREHWLSIQSAYNLSPFFEFYKDELDPFYTKKYEFLLDFNTELLVKICSLLKMNLNISFTETYTKWEEQFDYRNYDFQKEFQEKYIQVFNEKYPFIGNLSIYDALFNLGNQTKKYLQDISKYLPLNK